MSETVSVLVKPYILSWTGTEADLMAKDEAAPTSRRHLPRALRKHTLQINSPFFIIWSMADVSV